MTNRSGYFCPTCGSRMDVCAGTTERVIYQCPLCKGGVIIQLQFEFRPGRLPENGEATIKKAVLFNILGRED